MMRYWEFYIVLSIFLLLMLWTLGEFAWAWWQDRRRWRAVAPHYGSAFDASVQGERARPNTRKGART